MPHNRTMLHNIDMTAPGAVDKLLAHHRARFGDLRMDAGAGAGNAAPADQGGAGQTGDQTGLQPVDQGTGRPADQTGKVKITGEFDADRAARALEGARSDAATERTKRQAAEKQTAAVLKALGLDPDGKPDAKALGEQVETERASARQARVELAVFRAAGKAGGDPDALLDSRAFLDSIAELDPTGPGFSEAVAGAIVKAIEGNDRLKAAPTKTGAEGDGKGAGQGGVPLSGGPNGSKPTKPTTLEEALIGRV
jgi:hypothetical protein